MLENNFSLLNLHSEFNIFLPKVTDIWGKAYFVFDFWPVSLDWARGAIFHNLLGKKLRTALGEERGMTWAALVGFVDPASTKQSS